MKLDYQQKVGIPVILRSVLLQGLGSALYWSIQALAHTTNPREHSNHLLTQREEGFSRGQDAETGQRDFILSGQPRFFAPYRPAIHALSAALSTLRQRHSRNPGKQADAAQFGKHPYPNNPKQAAQRYQHWADHGTMLSIVTADGSGQNSRWKKARRLPLRGLHQGGSMGNNCILLVEDNPNDQELTIRAFKKNNISNEIIIANNGVEALDYLLGTGLYASRPSPSLPQLVILDLKLPKVSGLEVLQQVREQERTKYVPIVILTSSAEEKDIIDSYRLGSNAYVRKPVNFIEFTEAVKQLGLFWLLLNKTCPQCEHGIISHARPESTDR